MRTFAFLLLFATVAFSQASVQEKKVEWICITRVGSLGVRFYVKDSHGKKIPDLTEGMFSLTVNGRSREFDLFKRPEDLAGSKYTIIYMPDHPECGYNDGSLFRKIPQKIVIRVRTSEGIKKISMRTVYP